MQNLLRDCSVVHRHDRSDAAEAGRQAGTKLSYARVVRRALLLRSMLSSTAAATRGYVFWLPTTAVPATTTAIATAVKATTHPFQPVRKPPGFSDTPARQWLRSETHVGRRCRALRRGKVACALALHCHHGTRASTADSCSRLRTNASRSQRLGSTTTNKVCHVEEQLQHAAHRASCAATSMSTRKRRSHLRTLPHHACTSVLGERLGWSSPMEGAAGPS